MRFRVLAFLTGAAALVMTTLVAASVAFGWFRPPEAPLQSAKAAQTPNSSQPASPNQALGGIQTFLGTYCIQCHGAEKQKGDRRFDQLNLPVSKVDTVILLQDIVDQLNQGTMPPKKAKQPRAPELRTAIADLTQTIAVVRTKFASSGGQTVLRRQSPRVRQDRWRSLLAEHDDVRSHHEVSARRNRRSHGQHRQHVEDLGLSARADLDAADQVVEKAFATKERPVEKTWKFAGHFVQQPSCIARNGVSVSLPVSLRIDCFGKARRGLRAADRACPGRAGGWLL